MKTGVAFVLFLLLSVAGCAMFGGDLPIRVAGSISLPPSQGDRSDCWLSLVSTKTARVLSSREVPSDFSTDFVIEARSRSYYFSARCGGDVEFRSPDMLLGGRGSFDKLIKLGVLAEYSTPEPGGGENR